MRFQNLDPAHCRPGLGAVLRWAFLDRWTGRRCPAPPGPPADRVPFDPIAACGSSTLTWLGHSSILGSLDGENFLIDPVFSPTIGWGRWNYPRHVDAGATIAQLPPLNTLLLTHNHYDHFDIATLRQLDRSLTVITPSKLGRWFCRAGFVEVIELGWWESTRVGGLTITCVPARHWSRRSPLDTNCTLWGGFVIEKNGVSLYHAGDTAWFKTFDDIAARFPRLTAALLPIGGYEPEWFMRSNHLTPEEAGEACLRLRPQHCVPIHWGTFQMSDEPLREPSERLQTWWQEHPDAGQLHLPAVGQTVPLF